MAAISANNTIGSHAVDELTLSLDGVVVDDAIQTQPPTISEKANSLYPFMRIYTRAQILFLSKSPLVQLPPGMPELKEWFGSENEQNLLKKEAEPTTPGSARERRFRRDMEDGETPPRPTFRSALSQPSQMGNFKHQSLRANDREREADRDRERDIRDKEGHERLRHLSDKYDRDRLALPSNARTKERDAAPHLSAASSSRAIGPTQMPPGSSRRADARDTMKKKAGEVSEDWRKGPDVRASRDERVESGRNERAKSRARDSSRPRRENSPSRREREPERELDDDPRRWRDDGKRDERIASRRSERHKDVVLDPADRRWVAAEDRENRTKRLGPRDRKHGVDEVKDRDDRKDREREKEKEPAWMDTYVPSSPSAGILGGKIGDGELDGIQAWKKERKEKEMKDKVGVPTSQGTETASTTQESSPKPDGNGNNLDEIQLFRLLMKREEEKKKTTDDSDDNSRNTEVNEKSTNAKAYSPSTSNGLALHEPTLNARPPLSNGATPTPPVQTSPQPDAQSVATAPILLSLLGDKDSSASSARIPLEKHTQHNPLIQEPAPQIAEVPRDSAQFNPPVGSRLLAFARKSQNTNPNAASNGPHQPDSHQHIPAKADALRSLPGFSAFEERGRSPHSLEDLRELNSHVITPEGNRRPTTERLAFTPPIDHPQFSDSTSLDNGNGYSANKGSRFAKFFDAKGREGVPALPKTSSGLVSSSPGPGNQKQQEHSFHTHHGNGPDPRAMDEIYAMLSSSAQGSRGGPLHPSMAPMSHNGGFGSQPQTNLLLLQQQQAQNQQQQQHIHPNRLEPLYESRLDDRNFVPDGMVPGLRSAPPPRNREMYSENIEDSQFNVDLQFSVQHRLPPQQQRNFEQLYSGGPPAMYGQQTGRNSGAPLQSNQYRGGPLPLSHQQNHNPSPQQRLPPGLANLGGRPPHEPSQFVGMPGMPNPGLLGALQVNNSNQQQPFNGYPLGGNIGYTGTPPIRGPHQLQGQGTHLAMGGHPNLDLRTTGQNQILGVGGMGGLRGSGGIFPGQQTLGGQMPPMLSMRQQQQQLPPHMMPHILPPHMQHHGSNSSQQPAHDLMTLLMGGTHRE